MIARHTWDRVWIPGDAPSVESNVIVHVRDQRMCPVDVSSDRSAGIGPVLLPAASGAPACANLALLRSMDVDPMSLAPLLGGLRFAIGEKKPRNKPSGQKSGSLSNKMRTGKLITVC